MKRYAIKIVMLLALYILLPTAINTIGGEACNSASERAYEEGSRSMGVTVYIHLFDINAYREKVLPAYKSFFRKDDAESLIGLLKECIRMLDAHPHLSEQLIWDRELCEEAIGIINGTVYYSPDGHTSNQGERKKTHKVRRDYARGQLSPYILQILCVPHDKGLIPEQNMTKTPLISYLYERSSWIEELFTFSRTVRGAHLELSIGASSKVFTKEDVQEFDTELSKVAPPEDPKLKDEFNNLCALVKLASKDPSLTLLLSVT
jgi:hypothetical protein